MRVNCKSENEAYVAEGNATSLGLSVCTLVPHEPDSVPGHFYRDGKQYKSCAYGY